MSTFILDNSTDIYLSVSVKTHISILLDTMSAFWIVDWCSCVPLSRGPEDTRHHSIVELYHQRRVMQQPASWRKAANAISKL